MIRKILYVLGGLIVLIVAAVVVLPMVIPADTYKGELARQVKAATGRDIDIKGELKFALLPSASLSARDVTLSNVAGSTQPHMLQLDRLDVEVRLIPLLFSQRLELETFVLTKPVIVLEKDKQGRPNWAFVPEQKPAPPATAPAKPNTPTSPQTPPAAKSAFNLDALQLPGLRIIDGLIRYNDAQTGQKSELRNVNMTLSLPGTEGPAKLNGSFALNGKPLKLDVNIAKPGDLLAGGTSAVVVSAASDAFNFDMKGTITNAQPPRIFGAVEFKLPSLKAAFAWAGVPAPDVEVSNVNMVFAMPSADAPARLAGKLTWNGKAVDVNVNVAKPNDALAGAASPLTLAVISEAIKVNFNGSVANATKIPAVTGALDLDVPSIKNLAGWVGAKLQAKPNTMGVFKVQATLQALGPAINLQKASIQFDDIKMNGDLSASLTGKVPYIKAKLDVGALNLNPYMGAAQTAQPSQPAQPQQPAPPQQPKAQQGWSDDPIDASALRSLDAELAIAAKNIVFDNIKIDQGNVALVLRGGKLQLDLTQLALYKGTGSMNVGVDASGPALGIAYRLNVQGVQAEPFLRDAADFSRIQGTASIALDVRGTGRSQRQIISALNGKGNFKFTDGAIKGFNLAEMVRSLGASALSKGFDNSKKTDFALMSASFDIVGGVAKNDDLILQSPLLRVAGKGTVSLPPRTVDYRVEPKLVGTLKGQDAGFDKQGIVVPVRIHGSWDNPSYEPDLAAALQLNQDGTIKDAVKSLSDPKSQKELGKQLEDVGKGLLGKPKKK